MTPKQEAFARAYVETGNASEAYRQAYNAEKMSEQVVWNEASKLLQHHEVAIRIKEAQEAGLKRTAITVETLTKMAMKAYDEAQRVAPSSGQMQTSAMVKATEFIGKLHGLLVDKSEVKHVSGAEDLNDAELANLARSGRRGTAGQENGAPKSH